MIRRLTHFSSAGLVACGMAALALGACNKAPTSGQSALTNTADAGAPGGALPPTDASPTSPPALAPDAAALPPAPAAQVAPPSGPSGRYRYADDAQAIGGAFANSPPDYAVDYNGARPWVWRSGDGAYRVVEAVPGGERYYYYHPGQQTPFFVQDPRNAYAYDGGRLTVVYDAAGRPLAPASEAARAEIAGRFLARARALYYAVQHGRRVAAHQANWEARRNLILQQPQQWTDRRQSDAGWRAWRDQHANPEQAALSREQAHRQVYVAQLAASRHAGVADAARVGDQARQAQLNRTAAQQQAAALGASTRRNQLAAQQSQSQASTQAGAQRQAQLQATRQAEAQAMTQRQAQLQAARQMQAQRAAERQAQMRAADQARAQAAAQAKQSRIDQPAARRQAANPAAVKNRAAAPAASHRDQASVTTNPQTPRKPKPKAVVAQSNGGNRVTP